jgi:hypothetical protein
MKHLVLAILMGSVAMADELVLKDGKKVVWKSITEDGDSYTVQTKDGQTIKVKKADVERFVLPKEATEAPVSPLTGASFSMGKKLQVVNLMPKAEVEKSGGSWKLQTGPFLLGEATMKWGTLSFDYEIPTEDYDLTLVVERVSGQKTFVVGVGTSEGLCGYHFDAWEATTSCLALLDGKEGEHTNGQVFKKGKACTVKLSVRKEAFKVEVDGKPFWMSRIAWPTASLHQEVKLKDKSRFFLSMDTGSFKVHSFTVSLASK